MAHNFGGIDYHEKEAMPIRQPAYAELLVDSEDRAPGQTPANFTIYRNQALLYGYFYRLAITQLQLHWDMPTIVSDVNNKFEIVLSPGPGSTLVVIPEGYYTPTTLAAAIQTAIQAAGGAFATFTCAFNDLNGGFIINSGSAAQFTITAPNPTSPSYSLFRNTARSIGLTSPNYTTPAAIQNLGSPGLLYTRYIDIISRNLTKYQRVKDSDTSATNVKSFIVARIYLSPSNSLIETTSTSGIGSKPFTLTIDYNTPKFIKYSPDEALNESDLQVLDEYGDQLYWDGTAAAWEFAFSLYASES
jgi:hypothetical protein